MPKDKEGNLVSCKEALIETIRGYGLTTPQSKDILEAVLDKILVDLKSHGRFLIRDFGTFYTTKIKGRKGKLPDGKRSFISPDQTVVRFNVSENFKKSLNPKKKVRVMNNTNGEKSNGKTDNR